MKWLTSKRQVKILYAVAALVTTCGAAMAATDSEQFARFKDPNQWGAPAGDLNQNRYSSLKEINASNVHGLTQRAHAASIRPSIRAAIAKENEIEKPT